MTDRHPVVVSREAISASKCTCGTRIAAGDTVYSMSEPSESLASLLRGIQFCSPKCVRAFCLEALQTLDAFDTPSTRDTVTDLHAVIVEVAETFLIVP